ncbi:MAG: hypothetical protein JO356_02655 [Acidobacteria bacterium]|nr:hypothetical protein [Acidobacteriota bacterium]
MADSQWKPLSYLVMVAAIVSAMTAGCSSSKPRVTETTVTQTNPETGTTVTKTTGVEEKGKNETTTWTSTTVKK